jgi:hypothetical protein
MKNFSKTITAVSLSLLTIGAMAQIPFTGSPNQKQGIPKVGPSPKKHNVSSTPTSFQLWYVGTDAGYASSYSTSLGYFTDQINSNFTRADTNALASRENYNLIQSVDVAYDTLIDGSLNPYNMSAVYVDTLWAVCAYKNTTGNNDTLVFTIKKLTANGLPTGATYTTIAVPLYKGVTFATNTGNITLPGTSVDSLYDVIAIPAFMLPAGNIHFDVNLTFKGSKLDTFELGYGFPLMTCSSACGSYDYANPHTFVGAPFTDTRTIDVNSLLTDGVIPMALKQHFLPQMEPFLALTTTNGMFALELAQLIPCIYTNKIMLLQHPSRTILQEFKISILMDYQLLKTILILSTKQLKSAITSPSHRMLLSQYMT